MKETNVFVLLSFKIMELEVNLFLSIFIFCDNPGWFLSAISSEICKHCFAILFSGKFCKCIQNLKMEVSIFNFNENLPSSFLAATFRHRLFTPKDCLQRKICVFSITSFSQVLKSSLS